MNAETQKESDLSPQIVAAGDGVIGSGAGVTLTFKVTGAQSGGQWLVLEYEAPPHFSGPPPHVHHVTTELFYVLEGTLTLFANQQSSLLQAGGFAYVPPGTVHTFANSAATPAKYLMMASPAGLERYFQELSDLIRLEATWPPTDMAPIIALMAKYDTYPAR
jgi:quercetin dioxygenase-like cupin family protein